MGHTFSSNTAFLYLYVHHPKWPKPLQNCFPLSKPPSKFNHATWFLFKCCFPRNSLRGFFWKSTYTWTRAFQYDFCGNEFIFNTFHLSETEQIIFFGRVIVPSFSPSICTLCLFSFEWKMGFFRKLYIWNDVVCVMAKKAQSNSE